MPRYEKGQSGNPLGKPKGCLSRPKRDIWKILDEHQCDPHVILCKIATDRLYKEEIDAKGRVTQGAKVVLKVKHRLEAATALAKYCRPTLRSVTHQADDAIKFFFNSNVAPSALTAEAED